MTDPPVTEGYRRFVLGILLVTFTCNYIDRQVLAILLPAIKKDLLLSDSQLGFLTGLAFAIFFVGIGIPAGRLADRVNRRNLIASAIAVWSLMTAACGFAQSFTHLALARVGVGIGEAGCTPPSHSLISDYFPQGRRAMALSVYSTGIAVGILIGFLAGGWINEWFDWRTAFVAVGLPGVLLALVVRLTLREPKRGGHDPEGDAVTVPTFGAVARHLWAKPSYRHFILGGGLTSLAYFGAMQWAPSFFDRSHGLSSGEIGSWLAPIMGFAGGAGTLAGGKLVERFAAKDVRWTMWWPAIAGVAALPCTALVLLWPTATPALALMAAPVFLFSIHLGPLGGAIQGLSNIRMRGVAVAVSLFITNVIGLGIGPQAIGLASDLLRPVAGVDSLRYALLLVALPTTAWATAHFIWGARTLGADLALTAANSAAPAPG
jgi:predicted MFS family arabinose efflux permease